MSNASRDDNRVPVLLAVSSSDGSTATPVQAQMHGGGAHLLVSIATGGTDLGPTEALRDQNRVTTLMAVSSVDGVTPVPVYVDSNGRLLMDRT